MGKALIPKEKPVAIMRCMLDIGPSPTRATTKRPTKRGFYRMTHVEALSILMKKKEKKGRPQNMKKYKCIKCNLKLWSLSGSRLPAPPNPKPREEKKKKGKKKKKKRVNGKRVNGKGDPAGNKGNHGLVYHKRNIWV